jgi:hypothetical protein
MESRAEIVVRRPDGTELTSVELPDDRLTIGRLPDANDVALEPDPQQLVTRSHHLTLERHGGELTRVDGRAMLQDGDTVCVLGSVSEDGDRKFFELDFNATLDSQATRVAPFTQPSSEACLSYDSNQARLLLVAGAERHEIPIRAQAHRLVRYMVERNEAAGGEPALCTHDELMYAVWADEPMHSREELAKLMWELRKKLEPFRAEHLIENERRLGYRLRTCRER